MNSSAPSLQRHSLTLCLPAPLSLCKHPGQQPPGSGWSSEASGHIRWCRIEWLTVEKKQLLHLAQVEDIWGPTESQIMFINKAESHDHEASSLTCDQIQYASGDRERLKRTTKQRHKVHHEENPQHLLQTIWRKCKTCRTRKAEWQSAMGRNRRSEQAYFSYRQPGTWPF